MVVEVLMLNPSGLCGEQMLGCYIMYVLVLLLICKFTLWCVLLSRRFLGWPSFS